MHLSKISSKNVKKNKISTTNLIKTNKIYRNLHVINSFHIDLDYKIHNIESYLMNYLQKSIIYCLLV